MGQKIHPRGLRIGSYETWQSKWFANSKDFAKCLGDDKKIRQMVKAKLTGAGISKIGIERAASRVKVNIFSAKPGLVIGKKGAGIEDLRSDLKKLVGKDVGLNIIEVRKADMDSQLIAENIAFQIEKRVSFRRAMKESASRALRAGAEGVRIRISGRLNNAEIARSEQTREKRVPLHTLRADVDYGFAEAKTQYGIIGIKVWVFKGEKFAPGEEMPVEAVQL